MPIDNLWMRPHDACDYSGERDLLCNRIYTFITGAVTTTMPTNYYSILQVHTDAELEIIEAAYKRLARKYHPDINRTTDATLHMQQINEAYEVLADPEKRALYDHEIRHNVFDADELLRQLGLAEIQLMDEQLLREEIEQLKLKRAEKKSLRLADQLKENPPKVRLPCNSASSTNTATTKSAQLLLQRKYALLERKLADEQCHNQQLQEELSLVTLQLSKERSEREYATRGQNRLEHLLVAERLRREKCEEEMRLAAYERHATEKAEALRDADQANVFVAEDALNEEKAQGERVKNELAAVRRALQKLSQELS